VEQAEYQVKLQEREAKGRKCHPKPRGPKPQPPEPGPQDGDQFNFTDPESRIMKNSTNKGMDQHYNVQVSGRSRESLNRGLGLIESSNDKQEAEPTLNAPLSQAGKTQCSRFGQRLLQCREYSSFGRSAGDPYIATGREPHHKRLATFFQEQPEPPAENASPKVKMAYKLQTQMGRAIYRLRKCTVEPVIWPDQRSVRLPQFSLRGLKLLLVNGVSSAWHSI